jgi:hypothetical protein
MARLLVCCLCSEGTLILILVMFVPVAPRVWNTLPFGLSDGHVVCCRAAGSPLPPPDPQGGECPSALALAANVVQLGQAFSLGVPGEEQQVGGISCGVAFFLTRIHPLLYTLNVHSYWCKNCRC